MIHKYLELQKIKNVLKGFLFDKKTLQKGGKIFQFFSKSESLGYHSNSCLQKRVLFFGGLEVHNFCLQRLKKVAKLLAVNVRELLPGLLAVAWQLRRKFEAPFEVRAIGW